MQDKKVTIRPLEHDILERIINRIGSNTSDDTPMADKEEKSTDVNKGNFVPIPLVSAKDNNTNPK